jgi:copper transport protein
MLAFAALAPSPLLAHTKLVHSDPAGGAKLENAPGHVTLTFSERAEIALSNFKLVGPMRDTIVLASLRHEPGQMNALTADVPVGILPGNYRLVWTAAGKDGHVSHGTIDFFVNFHKRADAARKTLEINPPAAPMMNTSETMAVGGAVGSIIARWIAFASCFLLIGVMTFRFVVLRRMGSTGNDVFTHIASTNAATLGTVASVTAIFAAILKVARESNDMPDATMSSMMLHSTWGWSLVFTIVGAIVASVALYMVHKPGRSENAWRVALAAVIVIAVCPGIASHAAGSSRAYIAVPADIVHLIVGGMWLGTLAVIVMVGISAALKAPDAVRPGARMAEMINVFSPVALTCGAAVVLTGVTSALLEVRSLHALWTTPYGVILLLKLFFVALLFAAGAWNWQRMKPRLTGDDSIAPIKSTASLELLLAVAVLAVTAILVALELP